MRWLSDLFKPRKRCFSSEAILLLDKIIVADPNIPVIKSNLTITFEGLPLRISKKEILKAKGTPRCKHLEEVGPFPTCIIGYFERINKVPVRIHFFLHKEHVWFSEYRFNAISADDMEVLRESIRQKYCPKTNLPKGNFTIEDGQKQRLLFYDNGISTHIKFFDTTSPEATNPQLLSLFDRK